MVGLPSPVATSPPRGPALVLLGAGAAFLPFLWGLVAFWASRLAAGDLEAVLPGVLIPPLLFALLVRQGARDRAGVAPGAALPARSPGAARGPLLVGGGAAVVALVTALSGRPAWGALLLPPYAGAAWWLWRGRDAAGTRLAAFALLAFVAPLPVELLRTLQPRLSLLGATVAQLVGHVGGIAPVRTGWRVSTATFYIEVVDSCSGLYMVLMFGVIALVLVQVGGWRGRAAAGVLALAPPLGLLLNATRLSLLLLLGHRDPRLADSTLLHDLPGALLFALGVLVLYGVGRGLTPRRRPAGVSSAAASPT